MTWNDREARMLEAILAIEEADGDRVTTTELAETTGLSEPEAQRGLLALVEDGYLTYSVRIGGSANRGPLLVMMPRLRGKGRRAVGQWPADGFEALVAILETRIQDEPDVAKRSRLERLRDALVGVGREVVVDVIRDTIEHGGI